MVVEDTPRGVASARAAGLPVVAFPHAFTEGGNFQGASAVVSTAADLEAALSGWIAGTPPHQLYKLIGGSPP